MTTLYRLLHGHTRLTLLRNRLFPNDLRLDIERFVASTIRLHLHLAVVHLCGLSAETGLHLCLFVCCRFLALEHLLQHCLLLLFIEVTIVVLRFGEDLFGHPSLDHLDPLVFEPDVGQVVPLGGDLGHPWGHPVLPIACIDNSLMDLFRQLLLVEPVVADACLNLLQVDILTELLELLEFILTEDA